MRPLWTDILNPESKMTLPELPPKKVLVHPFLWKNAEFHEVLCHFGEIIRQPTSVSTVMPLTFDIAHLNCFNPKVFRDALKVVLMSKFGLQVLPKWEGGVFCHPLKAVFRCRFRRFPGQTVNFRLESASHILKAMHVRIHFYNIVHIKILKSKDIVLRSVRTKKSEDFAITEQKYGGGPKWMTRWWVLNHGHVLLPLTTIIDMKNTPNFKQKQYFL